MKWQVVVGLVLGAGLLEAQVFDVAVIRPSGNDERFRLQISPTTVVRIHETLSSILRWAYGIQIVQLHGPAWLQVECYNIIAKAAAPVTEAELRVMTQHLLAERLHLASHWEHGTMKVDVLRIPREAMKNFTPSESTWFKAAPGFNGTFTGYQFSDIAEFCSMAGALVVDGSGVPGRFDFKLNWAKYRRTMNDEERRAVGVQDAMREVSESLRTAIAKELGIRFTHEVYPVRSLVIDRVDRTPSDN